MIHTIEFRLASDSPQRLDRVVADAIEPYPELVGYSRSQLQRWIQAGQVDVDGKRRDKPGSLVQPGALITIVVPEPPATELLPSGRALDILFQDQHLLVLNKPAAVSMHPGAGRTEDTIAHAVIGYLSPEERQRGVRPGIVHRLDMDTTGIVVVAKTVQAHAALSRQFAGKTTAREYLALVYTTPRGKSAVSKADSGTIATQFGRDPKRRLQMSVLSTGGKRAVTNWRVLERFPYGAKVAVMLETGRTHQIRVHMNHLGAPVLGDTVYG
ncbi:MAG: RluA family pseudouridine synthase, partial [Proteobacteria bacterium]|nr:RluA family pseudouridine synthase [Pseudomonadota bacterium]